MMWVRLRNWSLDDGLGGTATGSEAWTYEEEGNMRKGGLDFVWLNVNAH